MATLRKVRYWTEILRKLLGHVKAIEFRPEHVDSYRERRLRGEGTKRGYKVSLTAVKHELEILNAAFQYAKKRGVLRYAPYIERPTQDRVREKEIPLDAFPKILKAIEDADFRDFIDWFLMTAMRPSGIAALAWDWLDLKAWTLKVPSQKGGIAREFSIEGTLRKIIERRLARRRLDCGFIFHRDGQPIKCGRFARAPSIRRWRRASCRPARAGTRCTT